MGGFESFAAGLLSAACGLPFVVAASGSQPAADAIATGGHSCIQAKRYRANTALNITDIVGNIYTALAAVQNLEVYVLVVTRDTAQLRQRAIDAELQTGLDIVILDAGEDLSPLGALVVTHWAAVRKYLPSLDASWDVWAARRAAEPAVISQAADATSGLRDGLRTQNWLRDESSRRLRTRFAPLQNPTAIDAWQRIDLTRAIPRAQIQQRLTEWWGQTAQPNGALEAEEGFGKTWTAAAFALQLASSGTTVLWLESNQWSGCDSIETLVRNSLSSILPDGDPRLTMFTRKALQLWRKPLLVVLDGVNEHGCFDAAQKLLSHYANHTAHYASRLRILFTTRPLEFRPALDKALWAICRKISIDLFDDQELTAALALHAPGLQLCDLSASLSPLVRIPRYFHLVIQLRERLRGHDVITKPLLLFADLLGKMEASAPAFRELYGSGQLRKAEEILAHLARNAKTHLPRGWEVSREHVDDCFPHLDRTLIELAEGRVVIEHRPGSVVVNDLHVSLGFALHLLHVGEQSKTTGIKALADEIAKVLEPNREQDTRTEALYLALSLTCLRPNADPVATTRMRSALLALWWNGHNAVHEQARLDFWAEEDVDAYFQAVEAVFSRHFSAPTEESLIAPLARLWRENKGPAWAMRPVLERWLALIYPRSFEDDSPAEITERAGFPVAEGPEMLRLSSVALSVVSQRPVLGLLPALARCARSGRFCVTKIRHEAKSFPMHLKNLGDVIGILLRWGFGEGIMADLESLARQTNDEGLLDGYRTLAILLQVAILPEVLKPKPKDPPFNFRWPDNSPAAVRTGLSQWIAHLPASDEHWPRHHELGQFAAYADLPDLTAAESALLSDFLEALGKKRSTTPGASLDCIEGYEDLLPWLARSQPGVIGKVHAACWDAYLDSENPDPIAWEPLVPIPAECIDAMLARIAADPDLARKVRSADSFSTHLATTVLISATEDAWLKWFEHLRDYPGLRYEAWEIIPAPFVLARVATPSFRISLRQRYELALAAQPANVATPSFETVFWLKVLATSVNSDFLGPDVPALAAWATDELRVIANGDKRANYFLRIVAVAEDAGLLEAMLHEEALKRHLSDPTLARTFGYFLRQPASRKIKLNYQDVAGQMPLNLARGFLLMASGEADLVDYSRAIAQAALARVSAPSGKPPFGFVSQFSVDEDGDIEGWRLERGQIANSYAQHCGGTALWGVDRGSLADFGTYLTNRGKRDESQIAFNAELVRQNERHDKLPDLFVVNFYGSAALETWARLNPTEYREFVRLFTDRLRADRAHLFDLGAFTYSLLRPLCRIDLGLAGRLHDEFFVKDVVRVVLTGVIPAFIADLWHHSLDGVSGIAASRKQTLLESRNDLHLLWITLSAISGQTMDELGKFIEQMVQSDWGKERALAVTLMAFTGEPRWLEKLNRLGTDDPSTWVRGQTKWACSVLNETLAARALWDRICAQPMDSSSDLELLAAMLVQLGPVLPVSSRWWPRPEWEARYPAGSALLIAFFGKWQNSNTSRGEGEFCGRRLMEFCCGTELGHDCATRLAPWWSP
jgi:hypothetical protein